MLVKRRRVLQLLGLLPAWALLRPPRALAQGSFGIDLSLGAGAPAGSRRMRLALNPATPLPRRTPGLLLFWSAQDERPIDVRVWTDSTRLALEALPGQRGTRDARGLVVPVSRAEGAGVYVRPVGYGAPGVAGGRVFLESVYGTHTVDVWIEPVGGEWRPVDGPSGPDLGIVAVHAALLRRGQQAEVLAFSPPRRRLPDGSFERQGGEFVWNLPELHDVEIKTIDVQTFRSTDAPMQASGLAPINLFCTGHAHAPDGQLLMAGGHISLNSILDPNAAWVHRYTPLTSGPRWQRLSARMRHHRWYPTVTVLPDGRALLTSGSSQAMIGGSPLDHAPIVGFYAHLENNYEVFDPRTGSFAALEPDSPQLVDLEVDERQAGRDANPLATYPAVFVLPAPGAPDGVVFLQEANRGWLYKYVPQARAPLARAGRKYRMVATRGSRSFPHYGSTVLLPFRDGDTRLQVLSLGGQHEDAADHKDVADTRPTTNTAEVFDFDAARPLDAQPGWRRVGPMAHRRALCDATLLPDGTVLVSGGVSAGWTNHSPQDQSVLQAELYEPVAGTFQPMASARLDRRYHATALLLPDATVLKMGSTGGFAPGLAPDGRPWIRPHFDGEQFFPPYLWRGPRPQITAVAGPGAEDAIGYARPLQLTVRAEPPEALVVKALKLGAVTHGLDMDQRSVELVRLGQTMRPDGLVDVTVRTPSSPAAAPPGDYMLFALTGLGVPSPAHFVRFVAE